MNEKKTIKVLLADDHQIMRDGLKYLIDKESGIEVIGETCQGRDTIEKAIKLKPDIVVMDVNMPNLDGVEATRVIIKDNPDIKVMVLSGHFEKHIVEQTLKAGASAYLHKESTFSELVEAIKIVNKGQTYLCPKIRNVLVNSYVNNLKSKTRDRTSKLNDKEYEIIRLLSLGKTTKEIAFDMEMSPKTVDAYRRDLMIKLNITSIAELVKFAIKEGLTVL